MALLTGVRATGPGRVVLEADGVRWRVVPADVAVRLGLAAGIELDRPLLRALARELRKSEALIAATRALGRRQLSRNGIAAALEQKGIRARERAAAIALLERYGAVDDERFAEGRAAALAGRAAGDAMILADLERHGIAPETAREAVAKLAPEHERARGIVEQRGRGGGTARYLLQRGFGADAVEHAVANGALEE